jgi:hypothetical protein
MIVAIRSFALLAVLALVLPAWADDPPKPSPSGSATPQMHAAGNVTGKLSKSGDDTITLKVPQVEQTTPRSTGRRPARPQLKEVEKDTDYDLASDAKIRWQNLPKKSDGKSYTDAEYKALREPAGAPGYKAEKSDLKAGQTVKLMLSKAGKDDKPVVTTVIIVADAPKTDDKSKKPN